MDNSKKLTGWHIGATIGATLSFALWIMEHAPYNFFEAMAVACLPGVFGLIGNYVQRKYFPEQKE